MTEREPMDHEQARTVVREAVLVSVALVARNLDQLDVPPQVLIEGADVELVAQILANMLSATLGAVLPDSGRQLLVRVSRSAVEDLD